MKHFVQSIISSIFFEWFINSVILINCILIGIETYLITPVISDMQEVCLAIFIIEIILRFIAQKSIKTFFSDDWDVFDLSLVVISLMPATIILNASLVLALRILRVFRILRLLRTSGELKLMVNVLIKSMKALAINALFYFIFLYLFAVAGVELFRLPVINEQTLQPKIQATMEQFVLLSPNTPVNSPDPYGTLHEAMFTLFRVMTGEDWTDIRYNLLAASQLHLIKTPAWVVTFFHIMWFCLSAFLLLNLVVGAIVNNYQILMDEMKKKEYTETV